MVVHISRSGRESPTVFPRRIVTSIGNHYMWTGNAACWRICYINHTSDALINLRYAGLAIAFSRSNRSHCQDWYDFVLQAVLLHQITVNDYATNTSLNPLLPPPLLRNGFPFVRAEIISCFHSLQTNSCIQLTERQSQPRHIQSHLATTEPDYW